MLILGNVKGLVIIPIQYAVYELNELYEMTIKVLVQLLLYSLVQVKESEVKEQFFLRASQCFPSVDIKYTNVKFTIIDIVSTRKHTLPTLHSFNELLSDRSFKIYFSRSQRPSTALWFSNCTKTESFLLYNHNAKSQNGPILSSINVIVYIFVVKIATTKRKEKYCSVV